MIAFLKRWYHGKTDIQHFDELNQEPGIFVFPMVYVEYHWSAQLARKLHNFYLHNWEFIWGNIIIPLAIAIFLA